MFACCVDTRCVPFECVPLVMCYVCVCFLFDGLLDVPLLFLCGGYLFIVFVVDKMHTVTSETTDLWYRVQFGNCHKGTKV